jgi:hypothetical protein
MAMEDQSIPQDDLKGILCLHLRRLAWSHLLETTLADRNVGFPCEQEELLIRRHFREAVQRVREWFRFTASRYNWPYEDGWGWEIDFAAGKAVPKDLRATRADFCHRGAAPRQNGPVEGPIMTLGDTDHDIIRRLLERRDAAADRLRSQLRHGCASQKTGDDLVELLDELGAAHKDVLDWFSEMSVIYGWPKSRDEGWTYRIDMAEKQVLLLRRRTSPLA